MVTRKDKSVQKTTRQNACGKTRENMHSVPAELVKQAVEVYDELGETVALHRWLYDVLHAQLCGDDGFDAEQHGFGLYLITRWLMQRDRQSKDKLMQLLKQLRTASETDRVRELPPRYSAAA